MTTSLLNGVKIRMNIFHCTYFEMDKNQGIGWGRVRSMHPRAEIRCHTQYERTGKQEYAA